MTFQPKLTPWQVAQVLTDLANGMTVVKAAEKWGVSERTVRRYKTLPPSKPGPDKQKKLKPCGTNAAWARHRKNGERPCPDCSAAHAADVKRHKAKKSKVRRPKPDSEVSLRTLQRRRKAAAAAERLSS